MKKYLFYTVSALMLFSGCAAKHEVDTMKSIRKMVQEQGSNINNNNIIVSHNTDNVMNRLKEITREKSNPHKTLDVIRSEMMTTNPQYAKKHIKQALVENKQSDEIHTKPMFLEPLFAKIEIMPYETKDGIYHEQESVWIKVKKGEIVLKTNTDISTVDDFKSVLSK